MNGWGNHLPLGDTGDCNSSSSTLSCNLKLGAWSLDVVMMWRDATPPAHYSKYEQVFVVLNSLDFPARYIIAITTLCTSSHNFAYARFFEFTARGN